MNPPAWAWVAVGGSLAALLAIDLRMGRQVRSDLRSAVLASAGWVAAGVGFGLILLALSGGDVAGQYFAGYLLEKSLSVDNVFVIAMIFLSLGVSPGNQRRVLFYGVTGALVMRAGFIVAGTTLVDRFGWALSLFGGGLVVAAWRLAAGHEFSVGDSRALRVLARCLPIDRGGPGNRFVVRRDGRVLATPLLVALVSVEAADIVFAADSIPAVFGVTRNTFVIFSSNAFALLGMRALYGVFAQALGRLAYLRHGLVALLGMVGIKMLADPWVHVSHWVTLGVIGSVLGLAVGASIFGPTRVTGGSDGNEPVANRVEAFGRELVSP